MNDIFVPDGVLLSVYTDHIALYSSLPLYMLNMASGTFLSCIPRWSLEIAHVWRYIWRCVAVGGQPASSWRTAMNHHDFIMLISKSSCQLSRHSLVWECTLLTNCLPNKHCKQHYRLTSHHQTRVQMLTVLQTCEQENIYPSIAWCTTRATHCLSINMLHHIGSAILGYQWHGIECSGNHAWHNQCTKADMVWMETMAGSVWDRTHNARDNVSSESEMPSLIHMSTIPERKHIILLRTQQLLSQHACLDPVLRSNIKAAQGTLLILWLLVPKHSDIARSWHIQGGS